MNLIEFFTAYGWQLTLVAIGGIVLLGILKYAGAFEKLEEKKRHYLYIFVSVCVSALGAIVVYYTQCEEFDINYLFTIFGAIYSLNQTAYNLYKVTPLRDLVKKIMEKVFSASELDFSEEE